VGTAMSSNSISTHSHQAYHQDADWVHSVAEHLTDHWTLATLVILVISYRAGGTCSNSVVSPSIFRSCLALAVASGICIFCKDLTQHLLDSYGDDIGMTWGSKNSGWLLPWSFAISMHPVAFMGALSLVLRFSQVPELSLYVMWATAGAIGAMELVILNAGQPSKSGLLSAYTAMFVYLFGASIASVKAMRRCIAQGIGNCCVSKDGWFLLAGGMYIILSSYLLVVLRPSTCRKHSIEDEFGKVGPNYDRCPLPVDFNHDEIVHLVYILGVDTFFAGVVLQVASLKEKPLTGGSIQDDVV